MGSLRGPRAGLAPLPGELSEVLSYQRTEHVVYGNPATPPLLSPDGPGGPHGPQHHAALGPPGASTTITWCSGPSSKGSLSHHRDGNLKRVFEDPVFVDIGSAILNGEGAPTCRDLYEDEGVFPFPSADSWPPTSTTRPAATSIPISGPAITCPSTYGPSPGTRQRGKTGRDRAGPHPSPDPALGQFRARPIIFRRTPAPTFPGRRQLRGPAPRALFLRHVPPL